MDLEEIIDTFEALDPGEERYRYLIEVGKAVPGLPEEERTEDVRVHGCQSRVWMRGTLHDGVLRLRADSDAFIVRGLIGVLLAMYDGMPAADVAAYDPLAVFARIGLESHLSMGRRNGLHAMIGRIRALGAEG